MPDIEKIHVAYTAAVLRSAPRPLQSAAAGHTRLRDLLLLQRGCPCANRLDNLIDALLGRAPGAATRDLVGIRTGLYVVLRCKR